MKKAHYFSRPWDFRFLRLASEVASWSKDPSTKVGAVIVSPDRRRFRVGYNGFPTGIEDSEERLADRDTRLSLTIHAETNAILNATWDLRGHAIFVWGAFPCNTHCAPAIIQSGISCVVCRSDHILPRWNPDRSFDMFRESGVSVCLFD